jgi:hypothetical protein
MRVSFDAFDIEAGHDNEKEKPTRSLGGLSAL